MKEKRLPILLGILLVAITVTIGVSFAIWQITLQQESTNVITTGCFEVTFTDANPINLKKAYPISDEEGKILTPYEFTITNTCNSKASFQINLEVLNTTTLTDLNYIKESLNESTASILPKILTTNETVTKTLTEADSSYKLETGYLNANESKTYNLRLWLDENTPTEDAYMNKTFENKITIVTSYLNELPKTPSEQNIDYIKAKATSDMIIEDDGTVDHNLRYIGSTPSNYIDIGDKDTDGNIILWRVIGAMNNIDNGAGTKETRIKIIRSTSIGAYGWDASESSVNSGWGVNEWSQAEANTILNDHYYNSNANQICYAGTEKETTCDFSSKGLAEEAKKYIGEALWHTGSITKEGNYVNLQTNQYYDEERGDKKSGNCSGDWCNDNVERTTTWIGKIGLVYPSDYGYATSGGSPENREVCLNTQFDRWSITGSDGCSTNDWLNLSRNIWTITAVENSAVEVFEYVDKLYESGTGSDHELYPTVYLKANVKITSGEGTRENPFTVSIE